MKDGNLEIVFFGSPEFACPALRALVADGDFKVKAVVARPDRPMGRGMKLQPMAVKSCGLELDLPVFTPETKADLAALLRDLAPVDFFVVIAYGMILTAEMLAIPKFGAVNVHPSILPKYRGPSPVHQPILNGDAMTGVSVMAMDKEMDHGGIYALDLFEVGERDLPTLTDDLFALAAEKLPGYLKEIAAGRLVAKPQDHAEATYSQKFKKEDGLVDWNLPAEELLRRWRAFKVWPGLYTFWDGERVKILDLQLAEVDLDLAPGERLERDGEVFVGTGGGSLKVKGKR